LTLVAIAVAVLAATIALVSDVRTRRIPNWLTGSTLLIGLLVNLFASGPPGLVAAVTGMAVGFLLLIPFYVLRAVGAGDVKLLAALGAVLGVQALLAVAAAGALVGGLMSLIILARRGRLSLALHQLFVMHTVPTPSGAKAPYAVAIASGVYVAVLQQLAVFLAVGL
jgi:prepilin peptidase CpaA